MRPVLSRKTSSRVGSWSWRSATASPSESSARTIATRPPEPGTSRTHALPPPLPSADAAPKRLSTRDEAVAVGGIGGGRGDAGLADLRLQRRRGALGDDDAAVDDSDPVGERDLPPRGTGWSGRRSCPRRLRAARPPARASCGSAGRAPWSARRGRGSAGRGRARGRGRGAASCRPSNPRPCDRLRRRGRRARSARRHGDGVPVSGRRAGRSAAACAHGPSDGRRGPPPEARRRSPRAPCRPRWRCRSRRRARCPPVGGSSVVSIGTVVDLPAPFGPRKP